MEKRKRAGQRVSEVPECWREGTAILNGVTNVRHIEKVRFSQRLEGNRVNQVDDRRKSISDEGNCTKPLSGKPLVCV